MATFEQYFSQFLKTVNDLDAPSIIPLMLIHEGDLLRDEDFYSLAYQWVNQNCELYIKADNENEWEIYKEDKGSRFFVLDPDNDVVLKQVVKIAEREVLADGEDADITAFPNSDYCGEVDQSFHTNFDGEDCVVHAWFKFKV